MAKKNHDKEKRPKPKLSVRAVVVLDESGSMSAIQKETISAFNEYKNTLAKTDPDARLSLYKFSDIGRTPMLGGSGPTFQMGEKLRAFAHNVVVTEFPDLTTQTYTPDGMTPLYDAMGKTIALTDADWKKTKESVLVIVLTDGLENASKEFSSDAIRSLVEQREAAGWTFVYLGANQDPWKVSQMMGMSASSTMSYASTGSGVTKTMGNLARATHSHGLHVNSSKHYGSSNEAFFDNAGQTVEDYEDTPEPTPTPNQS